MADLRTLAVMQTGPSRARGGTWPLAADFSIRAARAAVDERAEAWLGALDDAAADADLVVGAEDICGLARHARLLEAAGTLRELADPIPGRLSKAVGRIAARRSAHVVACYYECAGKRVFNSAILVDPRGRVVGLYRKVQLAPGEEWTVAAGGALGVFPTAIGPVGIAIGDDLLYPEISSALARMGARIVAWPTGVHPGDGIVSTRAFDHGCTLLVGHPEHSQILDRRGRILCDGVGRSAITLKTQLDLALPDGDSPPPDDPARLLGYRDRWELLARRRRPDLLGVLTSATPPELDAYRDHRIPHKPREIRGVYRKMVQALEEQKDPS